MPSFIDPRLAPHIKEPGFVHEMLKEGKDPKDKLIEACTPSCAFWKDKLTRCEKKLDCLYPMRDWVTCIEACVK